MSSKIRQGSWSKEETMLLLNLIEEKQILSKIDGKVGRNKQYYMQLEESLKNQNFTRDWKQISVKWKNLKALFYKYLKASSQSGAGAVKWEFYSKMKDLLSERPRTQAIEGVSKIVDTMQQKFGAVGDSAEQNLLGEIQQIDEDMPCTSREPEEEISNIFGESSGSSIVDSRSSSRAEVIVNDESPSSSSASKRRLDSHGGPSRKRRRDEGWRDFIKVFETESEKDRKSRENMVESMNKTLSNGLQQLSQMAQVPFIVQLQTTTAEPNDNAQ